jgi:anti-sigma B factor antagonist
VREISFPVEVIEGVPVVTAPEEIDLANAAGLRAALLEAALLETAEPGRAIVVVDMSRTRFCDSAGLNALVGANRRVRAEGGEVRLVIVAEAVARIVALTGVDRVVPIYASLEEALTLGLAGALHAQGEVGLAFPVDLRVEHLVRQVDSGLRLQVDVRAVCLDDLVVLTRPARGGDF